MIDDAYNQRLVEAIRKRLLAEIEQGGNQGGSVINNNVYGGSQIPGDGVQGGMMGQGPEPEDRSYFVDIMRENLDPGASTEFYDPETGEPSPMQLQNGGWRKRVHRFSAPKKKDLTDL